MCVNCENEGIGRRDLMRLGAAGAVALGLGGVSGRARAAEGAPTGLPPKTRSPSSRRAMSASSVIRSFARSIWRKAAAPSPDIRRLGRQSSPARTAGFPPSSFSAAMASANCSSSRDAGNLINVDSLGTVEYGAAVLGSPLVVVLAHTACGAVKAACDIVTKNATYPGVIGRMIAPIVPAALAVRDQPGDFVDNAAKESARRTAASLAKMSPLMADLVKAGKVKTVAAIYDLGTGVVTFLD